MLSHTISYKQLLLVVLILTILVLALSTATMEIKAQNKDARMRTLLQQLNADDASFLVGFTVPVTTYHYWQLPGDIEYEGNIIGRLLIREIGDDYMCVDDIGQGITTIFCVPFSNIAYIQHYPYNPG